MLNLVPKMEEEFNKIGITLKDSNGQMKSTYDILGEMATAYKGLDNNTKNYYSALVGGKVFCHYVQKCA